MFMASASGRDFMILGLVRSLARDRSGASAAEYALLLGVVGTGFVLASFNLGHAIATSLEKSASLFSSRPELAAAAASPGLEESADEPGSATDTMPDPGVAKGVGVANANASKSGKPGKSSKNAAKAAK
jgi:pilus assembly protein Flp/PilA